MRKAWSARSVSRTDDAHGGEPYVEFARLSRREGTMREPSHRSGTFGDPGGGVVHGERRRSSALPGYDVL